MDLYDPQTLGVMVFGGFMVISAIGIFLVSTFSMKETSYEEALAKQRKEQEKNQQPKVDKKKKDKITEKKGKSKKKDEKPNGKIPEHESTQDTTDQKKAEHEPEPVVEVVKPVVREVPVTPVVAPALEKSAPAPEKSAPSPKDKKKKQEKKVLKVEPSPSSTVTVTQAAVTKPAPVLEVAVKEVPVIAVSPVGSQPSPPVTNALPPKKAEAVVNNDESKPETVPKKKMSKKKAEPSINESAGAIYLPYKTLVSTISSMVFSEGEAQKLIEILSEKNGIIQDTWHMATQKGDPVAALKRQLEEKEKLLSAEQEDAAAAKNKIRELNKELQTEKAKLTGVESKLKEQIVSRDQEIKALQDRMQASYQDHVNEIQQLQGKIRTLQEELENGPKAQLARLQQENSILRDALNQATSQTESKQNAELAKLRQECTKLNKELTEKSESLQQEEQRRKTLDGKIAAYEKQVSQLQTLQQEGEATLQKRLDEVSEELRKSQSSYKSLISNTEKAKEEQKNLADLQTKLLSYETESKQKSEELNTLNQKFQDVTAENIQLNERIKSIEALLEAGQSKDVERETQQQEVKEAEIQQLHARLQEKDAQISNLEKEAAELKDTLEQHKNKNETKESEIQQLHTRLQEKDAQISSLEKEAAELKDTNEQQKNKNNETNEAEIQQLHARLQEKDAQISSLEKEAVESKDIIEQQKNKNNDLREKNWQAMEALGLAEKVCEEKVNTAKKEKEEVVQQLSAIQTQTKEALVSLFPQITVESQQSYSEWLQEFREKSSQVFSQQQERADASELQLKVKEAEETQSSLQAECEQYRTILAETEGMLKDLQKSVEEEEQVWKTKFTASEEELRKSQMQVRTLEESVEKLKSDLQSTDQLKECISVMEAQLETQMNSASKECQNYSKEVEVLQQLLSETQEHLESTKTEARKQSKELSLLRQQLSDMQNHVHERETQTHPSEPNNIEMEAPPANLEEQNTSKELTMEEKSVHSIQEELEKLKTTGETTSGTEETLQMKERLDKEKKLTRDLGQAATKLLQLLKASQEQLAKEKEHNKLLKDQLQKTVLIHFPLTLFISSKFSYIH
ncbi:ribosome-binding protein 1 [Rhinophrynus dorsalis]